MKINNLIEKNYAIYIFVLLFSVIQIERLENIKVLYGDDSWVVIGSNYDSILDKVICCTLTHPGSSLIHQFVFSISPSTSLYLKILFIIFTLGFCLIVVLNKADIDPKIKFIFISLLLTSPMLSNYSLRSKTYIFDALICVYILFFLIRTLRSRSFKNYNLYIFTFFVFLSLTNIIPITSLFIILINKKIIKLKNLNFHYLPLIGCSILITYFSFQRRGDELNSFWTAYFAPTEGGITLFLRWFYYSTLRIFAPSNKLDLGALSFSITISVLLFIFGIIYLLKNQKDVLGFIFLIFSINLFISIFQIFPYGGSRLNIYYMPLVIFVCSCGVNYLINLNKSFENALFISFIVFSFISINLTIVSYSQTTRYFDQNSAEKIIEFVNTSEKNILIYHGGLWTIGVYFDENVEMEDLIYPYRGSGVTYMPIPSFQKKNIHVVCTKYEDSNKCFNKIRYYFETNFDELYVAGVHIRDFQYEPYLDALRTVFTKENILIKSEEVQLIFFSK